MLAFRLHKIIGFKMQVAFALQGRSPNDMLPIQLIRDWDFRCSE